MHNGEPYEEKIQNLRSKPITSSTKQVVQGDRQKKPRRTPSLEEAFFATTTTQCKIVTLNFLKSH